MSRPSATMPLMHEIQSALELDQPFTVIGNKNYPSCFAVSDLASTSIGAVGGAVAALIHNLGFDGDVPDIIVDQRLASLWFSMSIKPVGWKLPPIWDAIAGDYQTRDGWIKLHTNLPHHRAAALSVLGIESVREKVAEAVRTWNADELETAIVGAGGVAAAMRTRAEWETNRQGKAVASEPLIAWSDTLNRPVREWGGTKERPLDGLRVLDLTRVLAGPVATRTLAGFGADVLRIDPPGWDEANIVPDITLGKHCSSLSLDNPADRAVFERLLSKADVLVHGYRPGALDGLGLNEEVRRGIAPNLIEVCLDAYGWTGPWAKRRGFDSLVQMSCGIADTGMRWANANKPTPLPVQALDHATGYLMAAAAIRAVTDAASGRGIRNARLSLARTAELLISHPQTAPGTLDKDPVSNDFSDVDEITPWGKARRLKPPLQIAGTPMHWTRPACELGSEPAKWLSLA